jgi:hypothetical protein
MEGGWRVDRGWIEGGWRVDGGFMNGLEGVSDTATPLCTVDELLLCYATLCYGSYAKAIQGISARAAVQQCNFP